MGFDFLDFGFPRSGTDWKSINGKPFITVSAKGRSNGLSNKINDGMDFGPDTTLNASSPNQTGPPYSPTLGIMEAINYVSPPNPKKPIFLYGNFLISASILIPKYGVDIIGAGWESDANGNGINLLGTTISPSSTLTQPMLAYADPTVQNVNLHIYNVGFQSNQSYFNGQTLINLKQNETGGTNMIIEKCWFNGYSGGTAPNTANLIFEGNEDAFFLNDRFEYIYGTFLAQYGSITFENCIFDASAQNVTFGAQNPNFNNCTFRRFSFYNNNVNIINFKGCYWNPSNGPAIQVQGLSTPVYMSLDNCNITNGQSGSVQPVFGVSPGTTLYVKAKNTVFYSGSGTTGNDINTPGLYFEFDDQCQFLNGTPLPTIVKPIPTTPTVPASGTAQQNTNPYSVNVYLYGGTVTEIQITKNGTAYTVFSNATGLALSGQVYKLNPSDSITITYTKAPTWEWLSD